MMEGIVTGMGMALVFLVAYWAGWSNGREYGPASAAIEELDLTDLAPVPMPEHDAEAYTKAAEAYAVDRNPRRVPWNIRKRELEAAAKTKRKQIEEFRSI